MNAYYLVARTTFHQRQKVLVSAVLLMFAIGSVRAAGSVPWGAGSAARSVGLAPIRSGVTERV